MLVVVEAAAGAGPLFSYFISASTLPLKSPSRSLLAFSPPSLNPPRAAKTADDFTFPPTALRLLDLRTTRDSIIIPDRAARFPEILFSPPFLYLSKKTQTKRCWFLLGRAEGVGARTLTYIE